jgi:hypothetical protein
MTTETRTLIDLSDILAMQYKCTKCGATFSIPIALAIEHPMKCYNCRIDWHPVPDSFHRVRLNELTRAIAQSIQTLAEMKTDGINVNVRLEVAVHAPSVSK